MVAQAFVRNQLLQKCAPADFALLEPNLVPHTLSLRRLLITPGTPILALVFPETGFVSIVTGRLGHQAEIGMIGNEGLVGASPVLLGSDVSPAEHYVQAAGKGLSINIDALRAAVERSRSLERLLLRFIQTLITQTSQTAYVNLNHQLEARLARWLLMCQDRLGGTEIGITHELLAIMLGVQRTSVTTALQVLEGKFLTKARRARLEVVNRVGLTAEAGDAYGVPEAEYARLIGYAV